MRRDDVLFSAWLLGLAVLDIFMFARYGGWAYALLTGFGIAVFVLSIYYGVRKKRAYDKRQENLDKVVEEFKDKVTTGVVQLVEEQKTREEVAIDYPLKQMVTTRKVKVSSEDKPAYLIDPKVAEEITKLPTSSVNVPVVKRRGRPAGAKNKVKKGKRK